MEGGHAETGWTLLALGLFLMAGYLAHFVGRRAHVPRVTLLLLLGLFVGPHGLNLVPHSITEWFPFVAQLALSVVGFMLGERFLGRNLRRTGRAVLIISVAESVGAVVIVLVGLVLMGTPLLLSIVLAGISAASAPAATLDVVRESGAEGPLTEIVLGVVAVDDALAIILFSVLLVVAQAVAGSSAWSWSMLLVGLYEVFGAALLGAAVGVPMAWLTGRLRPGELTLLEALGFVFVCGGLASLLGVSYLLACMVLGAVVANRARHHTRPFHAIEGVSQPFLVVFFVLAGLQLDPTLFALVGLAGAGYVVFRAGGKILGAYVGARASNVPRPLAKRVGWCLLPQAGVALGLALLVAERFPEIGDSVLSLLVGTTFVLEVVGPVATRTALRQAGEVTPP